MEIVDYENYLLKRGHTKETVKTYSFQVVPFIATYPDLDRFTFKDVMDALSDFLKRHKNQSYKNTILCAIKRYYDFLLETGQRHDHPCRTMRFKAIRRKGVIHNDLFSSTELELLLDRDERFPKTKTRNQVITSLLIYQGLQLQEFENLKVNHVNLDSGKVYIAGTKRGVRRHLELHPKQYNIFDTYINESRNDLLKVKTDQLIVGMRGTPVSKTEIQYIVETFKPLFPDRNLTPETIRQSVISNWINERRFPLEQVQLMAGHAWISTTERYRQTPADEKRLIINRLHPLG